MQEKTCPCEHIFWWAVEEHTVCCAYLCIKVGTNFTQALKMCTSWLRMSPSLYFAFSFSLFHITIMYEFLANFWHVSIPSSYCIHLPRWQGYRSPAATLSLCDLCPISWQLWICLMLQIYSWQACVKVLTRRKVYFLVCLVDFNLAICTYS